MTRGLIEPGGGGRTRSGGGVPLTARNQAKGKSSSIVFLYLLFPATGADVGGDRVNDAIVRVRYLEASSLSVLVYIDGIDHSPRFERVKPSRGELGQ